MNKTQVYLFIRRRFVQTTEQLAVCLLMDCSYVIAFFRQKDWTSKRHYKALDVTVNQCLVPSGDIFKEFDFEVKTFVL